MKTEGYIKETLIDVASNVEYKYIENEGDFQKKMLFADKFGGEKSCPKHAATASGFTANDYPYIHHICTGKGKWLDCVYVIGGLYTCDDFIFFAKR